MTPRQCPSAHRRRGTSQVGCDHRRRLTQARGSPTEPRAELAKSPQISKGIWGELKRCHRSTAAKRKLENMPRRCRAELPSGPEQENRPAPGPLGLEANIITVPPTPAKSRKFPRRSGESSGEATGRRRRGAITAIFFYDAEQSCRAARAAVHARSAAWRICTTRQSSSSQASTFSRRTRMAWGKHTGGCRQQRFTTRFRTGVNGANKTWSTCTRHQRHTARPSVRNLDKCP